MVALEVISVAHPSVGPRRMSLISGGLFHL